MNKIMTAAVFLFILCIKGPSMPLLAQDCDIVLENRYVCMIFDAEKWHLKSFVCNGAEVLPDGGSTVYPWTISYLGPQGETPVLRPPFCYYTGGKLVDMDGVPTAVFTWENVLESGRWPLHIYVSLGEDSELPQWRIDASLPETQLETACGQALANGMAMEMEFDERANAVPAWGKESLAYKLRAYMDAFKEFGPWEKCQLAYYQGTKALRSLKDSSDPRDIVLYQDLCDFIAKRPFREQ